MMEYIKKFFIMFSKYLEEEYHNSVVNSNTVIDIKI